MYVNIAVISEPIHRNVRINECTSNHLIIEIWTHQKTQNN
jgi:hypothetical protein